jgi:hypothetical protein
MYKLLNLSLAGWAVGGPLLGVTARTGLALAILAYSIVVAVDLTRSVRKVLALPAQLRCVVIDAGALRRAGAPSSRRIVGVADDAAA